MDGQYRYASKVDGGFSGDVHYEVLKIKDESYETLEECEEHAKTFLEINKGVTEVIITRDVMKIELIAKPFEITKYE